MLIKSVLENTDLTDIFEEGHSQEFQLCFVWQMNFEQEHYIFIVAKFKLSTMILGMIITEVKLVSDFTEENSGIFIRRDGHASSRLRI